MEQLDSILSGKGEAMPASDNTEPVIQDAQPPADAPADTADSQDEVLDTPDGRKMVPLEALTETRGKVKRYTEQVAEFEKSMTGLRSQNEALTRQVSELLQRLPQPDKPQQQTPDIFENAPEAIRHTVAPQFEQMNKVLMANAQLVAGVKYGDEKVAEAEQAFIQALQSRTIDPADYHKVVNAPNRYAAAVQWHERHKALTEIGDDPAAYRAKLEAEILAKHGITPGEQKPQLAPVMPSNLAGARNVGTRAGPAWSGPKALNDIFSR